MSADGETATPSAKLADSDGAFVAPPPAAVLDPTVFAAELSSRNDGILSRKEQAALGAIRVLIAGCGSVGGAVVEPLTRLGVLDFVLADPDIYEVHNMNRQACVLADVGRPKVEVLAERVRAINPCARSEVFPDGITASNLERALDGVSVVFDGIDPAVSPREKWLVHERAGAARVPVVTGVDFGGKPTLYVWDYRIDQRPFHGKAHVQDFSDGDLAKMAGWLGYRAVPVDFMPVIVDRLATGRPWPQVAYASAAMGALGARVVLDAVIGAPLRHVISADMHMATRPARARIGAQLRWPLAIARTLRALRSQSDTGASDNDRAVPRTLAPVLEAMCTAPSAHNTQPWLFTVMDAGRVEVTWDHSRAIPAVDPEHRTMLYGLGCAIEAAHTVARCEFAPSDDPAFTSSGWTAGELSVHRPVDDYSRARALLGFRGTNRVPYAEDKPERELLRRLEAAVTPFAVGLWPVTDRSLIGRAAEVTALAAAEQFGSPAFLEEFLAWTRLSPAEEAERPDGFTARTLVLGRGTARLMRTLRASALARRAAFRSGLTAAIGRQAGDDLRRSGALVMLTNADRSPPGRLRGGRALMAMWLEATRQQLSLQPVTWALGADRWRLQLCDLFDAPPGDEAVALVRIGRAPTAPPLSPRVPVGRVTSLRGEATTSANGTGTR